MSNIDITLLTRDYEINPLKRGKSSRYGSVKGEIPSYADIYYLYITINLNLNELAKFFNRKRDSALLWLEHHNIHKNRILIEECMSETKLKLYGCANDNNYQKAIDTKIEKYGTASSIDGIKELWANISEEDKEIIVNKRRKTCLEKYGFNNIMKHPDYKNNITKYFDRKKRTKPEIEIENWLITNHINYICQYWIKSTDCIKFYDFYLVDYNVLIEYDEPFWHTLFHRVVNDAFKTQLANNKGYRLMRIKGMNFLNTFWEFS